MLKGKLKSTPAYAAESWVGGWDGTGAVWEPAVAVGVSVARHESSCSLHSKTPGLRLE